MKRILLVGVSILLAFAGISQTNGPVISWDESSFNFGDIKESDGPVTHKFEFTNKGGEPLVVTYVKPSCGCTTSDYTKEPVMPGAKGFVSATYDPKGRPGPFSKSVSVTTNCTPELSTIRFSGKVIEREKTLADLHPRKIGDLNIENNHISLLKVKNTEVRTDSTSIANLTDKPLKVTFRNVPKHINIEAVPETLRPNQKGKIVVKYDATKRNEWGFVMDKVTVAINDDTNNNKNQLTVSATIEEDFSKYTQEQLDAAPKLVFESTTFNFGTVTEGDKVTHSFVFRNDGKQDLVIRKISTSCGCTAVNNKTDIIKPGESSSIDITFNSTGKSNRQNKSITVICNDPKNAQQILHIVGDVKKK
ncbi:MAG: DUF1573 domain-containing protein [Salinivirgaceae bacterium]|nr:DUF1573 domain-containing protein [Salinivirgaceae bacterium]